MEAGGQLDLIATDSIQNNQGGIINTDVIRRISRAENEKF